ncbi:MAG TPA: alpha/beta fold hydrolase, partial [Paracoccaceae bacterium]|nr:alpha/beta fold hydrolase [Paracoccaceae bacterium]
MPQFLTSDGLHLHYEDEGAGLAVLCLSGLTRNARDFDFVAPHLAGVRLIRLDYRGRGQSAWSPDPLTYTVPREAQDVLELLDHLGLERVAILGTSRGGLIAMVLAAMAKHRLM